MRNERMLAYVLIGLGVFSLLARNGGTDWLWIALLGGVFLVGYVSRQNYGFLIAGGVLMGIAVGTLIDSQGGMLLSLAAGFFAIDRVERRPNRWPLYTAGILAVLGLFSALGSLGVLSSVGFALVLLAGGLYLLYREHEKSGGATYSPSTPVSPAAPTPVAETVGPESAPVSSAAPQADPVAAPVTETEPAVVEETVAETPVMETPVIETPVTEIPVTETPVATPPASPASTSSSPEPEAKEIAADAQLRLTRLEQWRKDAASTAGTPAYIIFSNDTLFRIASSNPQTLEELDKVRGVGPVKLERYGAAVLATLHGDPLAG